VASSPIRRIGAELRRGEERSPLYRRAVLVPRLRRDRRPARPGDCSDEAYAVRQLHHDDWSHDLLSAVDQALTDTDYHVFDDGRDPQDVTPAALYRKLKTMPGTLTLR